MKKLILIAIAATGLLAAGSSNLLAGDAGKEITITGTMVCGKCTLHETKECQNVVQVSKDGVTVNYFLKHNAISKAAHEPICNGSSEKVTVTGTVEKRDGKQVLTPSKIEPIKS